MKKTITLLFAFIMAFSLNSCGGSEDDGPSGSSSGDKIVGNWKYIGDTFDGTFEPETDEACDEEFLKFLANNSGQLIEEFCGEDNEVENFTWEKTGDAPFNYAVTIEGETMPVPVIIKFSSNSQKFTSYETEEDMNDDNFGTVYEK